MPDYGFLHSLENGTALKYMLYIGVYCELLVWDSCIYRLTFLYTLDSSDPSGNASLLIRASK